MFHLSSRKSLAPCVCAYLELWRCDSHLLATIHARQSHIMCVRSLAAERRSGECSEAGFGLCIFRHREGSMPINISPRRHQMCSQISHPHSSIHRSCVFIVLVQSWAATQDLWQPELWNGILQMSDFTLRWRWCFHPLRWFPPNTTYDVSVSECFGGALTGFNIEACGDGLGDARMERGGSAWDHERVFAMIASWRSLGMLIACPRSNEGGMVSQ